MDIPAELHQDYLLDPQGNTQCLVCCDKTSTIYKTLAVERNGCPCCEYYLLCGCCDEPMTNFDPECMYSCIYNMACVKKYHNADRTEDNSEDNPKDVNQCICVRCHPC